MNQDRVEEFEERAGTLAESLQLSREDSEVQAAFQMGLSDDEIEFLQGARE